MYISGSMCHSTPADTTSGTGYLRKHCILHFITICTIASGRHTARPYFKYIHLNHGKRNRCSRDGSFNAMGPWLAKLAPLLRLCWGSSTLPATLII